MGTHYDIVGNLRPVEKEGSMLDVLLGKMVTARELWEATKKRQEQLKKEPTDQELKLQKRIDAAVLQGIDHLVIGGMDDLTYDHLIARGFILTPIDNEYHQYNVSWNLEQEEEYV